MNYSEYRFEDINNKDYEEICNIFFSLAPNEDIKEKLKSILYLGGYDGFSITSSTHMKGDNRTEARRRVSIAYLLLRNPSTFDILIKNKINLYHGTNGNALPSIIKYGLVPGSILEEEGIPVITGEKSSRPIEQRNYVSFTDVLDLSSEYASLTPNNVPDESLSFPVIIGTTDAEVKSCHTCVVPSDLPEIGIKKPLLPEQIKVIFVPSDKVKFVKKLINNDKIIVASMDDMSSKFYYMDEYGDITIYKEKLKEMRDNLLKQNRRFSFDEIKEFVFRRGMSRYGR